MPISRRNIDLQSSYSGEVPPVVTEKGQPVIWVYLIGLFVLLISLSLYGYFSPSKTESDFAITEGLKNYALAQALSEMGLSSTGIGDETIKVSPSIAHDATIKPASAEVYIAAQTILHEPIPHKSMALLTGSKDSSERAFGKIYAATSLTVAQAKELAGALPAESWYRVASAEAYRKAKVRNPYLEAVTPRKVHLFLIGIGCFALFLVAGFVMWILYIAMRVAGYFVPRGHPAEPMTVGGADAFASRALTLLVGFIVLSLFEVLASRPLTTLIGDSGAKLASEAIVSLGSVGLAFMVFALAPMGQRIRPKDLGWNFDKLGIKLLWGFCGALSVGPLYLLTVVLDSLFFRSLPQEAHPIAIELSQNPNVWAFLAIGFIASVCAPIFEETLFRATLLPALSTRFRSIGMGILTSSFFFAAMHPTGPPSWLLLGGIGATSAGLMYQTRSIIPSIVLHATFNFSVLVLVLLIG